MALVKAKIINLDKSGDDLTVLFNPRILTVELFFDTYEEKKSVHEYTDKLQNYALVDPDKHQPPVVMFQWGKVKFKGVVETLNMRFTMFLSDGTACRAVR